MLDGNSRKRGLVFIFRDVTGIEDLQRRLARCERPAMMNRCTSMISHELRNALLPIRSAIQMLRIKTARVG